MKSATVDQYIESAPEDLRERLRSLRDAIRAAAPKAQEKISYHMAYYSYNGRLAYFAYFKHHIGLYIPPPVIADHKQELDTYVTATATVQFPHDRPLPIAIIKKLVKDRVRLNEK